jgi:pantoate--beta-alanine ligase
MTLFKTITPLRHYLQKVEGKKHTIGFVPTMGALHAGHISLINESRKQCDVTVCSIFVNPAQFNDPKDFEKYPVTIENDIFLLETNKTNVLFLPSVDEIYPGGFAGGQHFELGYLENILEGYYRPGHFRGVCRVVYRLLDIVKPGKIFLGQKDYQQCLVLKKMMQHFFPEIVPEIVETTREKDGLAMSSRNMRLTADARRKAVGIFEALQYIKKNITTKDFEILKQEAEQLILKKGFDKVDYVEICDTGTLLPVSVFDTTKEIMVLAAAFIEGVRLIDNLMITGLQ